MEWRFICRGCGQNWGQSCEESELDYICPECGHDNRPFYENLGEYFCGLGRAALNEKKLPEAADLFRQGAERGHAEAACRYAECLEGGRGVARSPSEVPLWLKKAAKGGGGVWSALAAGRFYRLLLKTKVASEWGADLDLWLKIAARLGDAPSLETLGDRYIDDGSPDFYPRRAIYCYARAAGSETAALSAECKKSALRAHLKLARIFSDGRCVEAEPAKAKGYLARIKDDSFRARISLIGLRRTEAAAPEETEALVYPEYAEELFALARTAARSHEYDFALLLYLRAYDKGCISAANCLGVCFERGVGCEADPRRAFEYYRAAADRGIVAGWLNLGDCYRRGVGCLVDGSAAFAAYVEAARLGNIYAKYMVANCYYEGRYTERDLREALRRYREAALVGHRRAMDRTDRLCRNMLEMYNGGLRAAAEGRYEEAFELYSASAELGHTGAICNLGRCYQLGLGVKKAPRAAVKCYAEAAEAGSAAAAYNLGICYLRGEGVALNYGEAKKWLEVAAAGGYAEAKSLISEAEARKSKKQLDRIYSMAAAAHYDGRPEDALRLRALACTLGHGRAAFLVGCQFEFGYGIHVDLGRASYYYRRASEMGYTSRVMKGAFLKFVKSLEEAPAESDEHDTVIEIDEGGEDE